MSSESSTAGRRLPVCRRCRQNHLRCDKKKPVCSACEKAKQPARCFYDPKPLRFSHSTYSAASDRLGNDTHRDVEIDHESDVVSDIVHGGQQSPLVHVGDPFQFAGLPDSLDQFRQQNLPVLPVTTGSEGTVPDIPLITSPSDGLALERSAVGAHGSHDATWFLPIHGSPVQNHALHSLPLGPSPMLSSPAGVTAIQSLSPTSREPTTILKEKLECKVFGFYITYMGKWVS